MPTTPLLTTLDRPALPPRHPETSLKSTLTTPLSPGGLGGGGGCRQGGGASGVGAGSRVGSRPPPTSWSQGGWGSNRTSAHAGGGGLECSRGERFRFC